MSEQYDVFEEALKPAEKPAPIKPRAEAEAPPNGLTEEEFATVRRDVRRMWNPEPEETR